MHEMSIAEDLVAQVLAAAKAHGAVRVDEVEVVCGEMRLVVPEALQLAFEALSAGTLAEGATLTITTEPVRARCRGCGREFGCRIENFACPGCGEADVEFLAGNDVVLKSLTADAAEGAET